MTLRESPPALDAQSLGRAAEALHLALLSSNPPGPGLEPVIHVFPAWPREWDAIYTLAARGAFLVTSSVQSGRIGFVEIESQDGAECRQWNPRGEAGVVLYRDGRKAESLTGRAGPFYVERVSGCLPIQGFRNSPRPMGPFEEGDQQR